MEKGNRLTVPISGQVTGVEESEALEAVANSKQFAPGPKVEQFEHEFAEYIGKKYALFVNSGSSANLLAVSAYKRHYIDELPLAILPAVLFPTTLNPFIQNNYWLKFIDIDIQTYQADRPEQFGVHMLGNYSEIAGIEDSCDAMFPGRYKAEVQTFSFFPAHFMTTGEGGMVTTNNASLYKMMKSIRDWGRDCWCKPGFDNTCGKRFDQQFGNMPKGYDHKYIYTNIGYNLNGTEMAAAIGIEQLKKLPEFLEIRKHNFQRLYDGLERYDDVFIMPKTVLPDTAWFSFPLTIRGTAHFTRAEIVQFLQERGIATRPIMAGNILRQPAYKNLKYEKYVPLIASDIITERSFMVGCWHGLSDTQIDYVIETIGEFYRGLW